MGYEFVTITSRIFGFVLMMISTFDLCMGDCNSTRFEATVLSADELRFESAEKELRQLFNTRRQIPLNITDPSLFRGLDGFRHLRGRNITTKREARAFSNFLAFHFAINFHASDKNVKSDSWRFFFEDDISLHPNATFPMCNLLHGMLLAKNDGILYLGMCSPICILQDVFSSTNKSVAFQKCSGTCAHAFGLTKWKAQTLLDLLQTLRFEHHTYDEQTYFDIGLFSYSKRVHPVWVIGSNLTTIQHRTVRNKKFLRYKPNHIGIFYQNREVFPTTIG